MIQISVPELPWQKGKKRRARRSSQEPRAKSQELPSAPAIHDDRLYRTKYDPGLGCGYDSRAERRRILDKVNNHRADHGEPKLMERGY